MSDLLYVNSRARSAGSVSGDLSTQRVQRWQAPNPGSTAIERSQSTDPMSHSDETLLAEAGATRSADSRLAARS